jgi:hypothetical protein
MSPGVTAKAQLFVLIDKPVAGRNCLVVTQGFSNLLGALQASSAKMTQLALR